MIDSNLNVVVDVDGPDPDNYWCILLALRLFGRALKAVIVPGRPVSTTPGARPYDFSAAASRAVRRDNALHMKGMLLRCGADWVRVLEGSRSPYSTIPAETHLRERNTDIYDDAHAGHELDGDYDQAVTYLASLPGVIHFISGGPATDLAGFLHEPMLHGKLGVAVAQLGSRAQAGITNMAGPGLQFNTLADPRSAHDFSHNYPGPICYLTTDFTKRPQFGFASLKELEPLAESSAAQELVAMYEKAWPVIWGRRQEPMFVHDGHLPFVLYELLQYGGDWLQTGTSTAAPAWLDHYAVSLTKIGHIPYLPAELPHWGKIEFLPFEAGGPVRLVVDDFRGDHKAMLFEGINSFQYG